MDASSRRILGLISETNTRFVIPVYQRPYSWDSDQCTQLWDDVIRCGRSAGSTHFTGSVVTIREGGLAAETTSVLLIDGQQRLTTITLLMMALACYANSHPNLDLPFSYDEIVCGGYLTNPYRRAHDHYKLTLSKDDRAIFQALVDALEHGEDPLSLPCHSRLVDNLRLFNACLAALGDVASVWYGLQRLEVVAISLTQGADDPQVIFESMNATGKDLSLADLVRNFVLMSHPMSEQRELYHTYWQPLEKTLGDDSAFDGFIRCYLAIASAPALFDEVDVYRAFKRYVLLRGYTEGDRMRIFALRLRRFAGYYVAATRGEHDDADISLALKHLSSLQTDTPIAFVVSLLDAYERKSLSRDELLTMLATIESYLVRRVVCDGPASILPKLFATLIARMAGVAAEGANCADALGAMLLGEADSSRHVPSDIEFAHALRTRDSYHLAFTPTLLARLSEHGAAADGGVARSFGTLERILPPHALADAAWRSVLGDEPERVFEAQINRLGNLTLTPYDFELQDGSLAEKRARLQALDGSIASIDRDIMEAPVWDADAITARTERLVSLALDLWRYPEASDAQIKTYRAAGKAAWTTTVSFADLFAQGLVQMDDTLVSASPLYPGRATITSRGRIMLANGTSFEDPADAYAGLLALLGAHADELDGWLYWRLGEGGPLLDDLRARLL